MTVTSIFASTINGGIGKRSKLPWAIKEDMRNFEHITSNLHATDEGKSANGISDGSRSKSRGSVGGTSEENALLIGRKTWESFPKKPLLNRFNCVVSRQSEISGAHKTVKSVEEGLRALNEENFSTVYVAGGSRVYDTAHEKGLSDYIIWTRVCGPKIDYDVSVNVPKFINTYEPIGVSKSCRSTKYTYDIAFLRRKGLSANDRNEKYEMRVLDYIKKVTDPQESDRSMSFAIPPPTTPRHKSLIYRGHEEYQYLDIMDEIIKTGVVMDDRTGVGTVSKFGALMRFDLSQTFPLLTTKRVYWKGVVEELLWFLRGDTDALKLSEADVHIWDGNGSKEFLKSRGLGHRREGDLGPVYGFQWRHFGAPYTSCDADYAGKGVDQVQQLIDGLRKDPNSRRHIVSAWNPAALNDMALPPCHVLSQFVVDSKTKELSCCLYQRSGDWGLGIPFNIASYSLLTLIIAHLTGLKPKEFVHFVANAHVYKNHIEPLQKQMDRIPRPFPRVELSPEIRSIDELKSEDIKLIGYDPYPSIKMEMAV